jgi:uncharacterized protein (UPF0261 family)
MTTIVLVGSLDTKGEEYAYARDRLRDLGLGTLLVDTGTLGEPTVAPDVTASEVAAAGGARLDDLRRLGDRGSMQAAMIAGATGVVQRLHAEGRLDGVLALGGSNNTSTAAAVFRSLPVGVPKLILTTMAVVDVRRLVGASDLVLAASVVDIAGLNHISRVVIANAAAAVAGMAMAPPRPSDEDKPLVACSMIGLTTRAVSGGRRRLEELGYEVVVFHMTGLGGPAMEELIAGGSVAGVLDLTTSELADELFGGVCSAGPGRLGSAARLAVPQVVAPGGLDMINFGRPETVPARFAGRVTQVHNAEVTLVRTNPAECTELGQLLVERVSAGGKGAAGRPVIMLPTGGFSAIDAAGQPFYDPEASVALADAVRKHADRIRVRVVDVEGNLDRPDVGRTAAELLHELITATSAHHAN